jgi:hypothetical protein
MDVSSLFEEVTEDHIKSIMVGTKVNLDKVQDLPLFRDAAIHCCLNGPVGTGKYTTFPGNEEEIRIKDLYDGRLSNKMWRAFCEIVGEHLIRKHRKVVEKSQQYKLYHNIWPQHEDDYDE